jgi:hypothetical protein
VLLYKQINIVEKMHIEEGTPADIESYETKKLL